jgi:hypothetical protein
VPPPLQLAIDAATPDGLSHSRWALDEHDPQNVPSGLSFSSTMPGGFETMSCVLPRKPWIDYGDLAEFSTITVYGAGGRVAWQGRLQSSPRTSGDQMSISPGAVGWQAALSDDKSARMIYLDCDLRHWGPPTARRKLAIEGTVAGKYAMSDPQLVADPNGNPAIRAELDAPWTPMYALAESSYDAKGIPLHSILYAWTKGAASGSSGYWTWIAGISTDDLFGTGDWTGNLAASGPGKGVVNSSSHDRTWGLAQFYYPYVSSASDTSQYPLYWTSLSVVGDHGLTLQGAQDYVPGAQGFLASDVVQHAVQTWAPELATSRAGQSTIEATTFVIPQLAFLDPTTAGAIITEALKYELLDWWVDDGPTFNLASAANHGKDWRAYVGPAGLQETGPQVDRMCNRVIVPYNDVTGATRTVGPTGSNANTIDDSLADQDPSNPVTAAGLEIYPPNFPNIGVSTPAAAIQVGQAFLTQQRALSTAGQATIVGHVQDDRGVLFPAWAMRAGDRITFVDAHDPVPRRIVKAQYSDDTKACQIDLDSPPQALQALLARMAGVIAPLGF